MGLVIWKSSLRAYHHTINIQNPGMEHSDWTIYQLEKTPDISYG